MGAAKRLCAVGVTDPCPWDARRDERDLYWLLRCEDGPASGDDGKWWAEGDDDGDSVENERKGVVVTCSIVKVVKVAELNCTAQWLIGV